MHILTGRLVVVHINSVKLQPWITHIVAGWVNAMLVADDFPELDATQLFRVSSDVISKHEIQWVWRFFAYLRTVGHILPHPPRATDVPLKYNDLRPTVTQALIAFK